MQKAILLAYCDAINDRDLQTEGLQGLARFVETEAGCQKLLQASCNTYIAQPSSEHWKIMTGVMLLWQQHKNNPRLELLRRQTNETNEQLREKAIFMLGAAQASLAEYVENGGEDFHYLDGKVTALNELLHG